jgi:hypothetical protein
VSFLTATTFAVITSVTVACNDRLPRLPASFHCTGSRCHEVAASGPDAESKSPALTFRHLKASALGPGPWDVP